MLCVIKKAELSARDCREIRDDCIARTNATTAAVPTTVESNVQRNSHPRSSTETTDSKYCTTILLLHYI